jgi:non-specific serine/threonine protein kinase
MYNRSELRALLPEDIFNAGLEYYNDKKYSVVRHTEKLIEAYVFCIQNYMVRVNFFQKTYSCNCLNYKKKGVCKHVACVLFHLAEDIEDDGAGIEEANDWKAQIVKVFDSFTPAKDPLWSFVFELAVIRNQLRIISKKRYIKKTGGHGRETHFHPDDLLNPVENELDENITKLLKSLMTIFVEDKEGFNELEFAKGVMLHTHPLNSTIIQLLRNVKYESSDDKVYLEDEPFRIRIDYQENEDIEIFEPKLKVFNEFNREFTLQNPNVISSNPLIVLSGQRIFEVENVLNKKSFNKLLQLSKLGIPKDEFDLFKTRYLPQINKETHVDLPENIDFNEELGLPKPRINLFESEGLLKLELVFLYESETVRIEDTGEIIISRSDGLTRINRNDLVEEEWMQNLEENHHVSFVKNGQFKLKISPFDWLYEELPKISSKGYEFYGEDLLDEYRVKHSSPEYNISLKSNNDWLDLKGGVKYGNEIVPFKKILNAVKKEKKYIKLDDGTHGKIPDEWIENFDVLYGLTNADGDELKINDFHVSVINSIFGDVDYSEINEKTRKKLNIIKDLDGIPTGNVPETLNGTLREYQKAGFNWMSFLNQYNLGGCLADDMGLGKTIQTLTLLLHQKEKKTKKPALIIAPTSLMFNWEAEGQKFAPSLKVLKHVGARRGKATQKRFGQYDVILTTYGILRRDIGMLEKIKFNYVILDESQNIKNPSSQNYKAVQQLQTENKLILTGTPIENNLVELWSQFDFINPGLLGNQTYFKETFIRDIVANQNIKRVESLKQLINPFILRRTKTQVAKELPEKLETIIYCDMPEEQMALYEEEKSKYKASILNKIREEGVEKSRMKILEALTKLRQICNHPKTILDDYEGSSGKLNTLFDMLEDILAEKHRVLIFSQYVKMLQIIFDEMKDRNIDFAYLDGSTKDREKVVNEFQTNMDLSVFLISLKAGGVGLNLTSADYVFIIDPWWNPAVEQQAIDRAYRIGQKKNVFVYKTIAKGTIEEKIVKLQDQKKGLVSDIITTDESVFKQLTGTDFEGLFE